MTHPVSWPTGDAKIGAQIEATLDAVCRAIPYFEPDDILSPATGDNPCAFARQVFLSILVDAFHLPKKRIAFWSGIKLDKVKLSCRSIRRRAGARNRFARWLAAVEADALSRFKQSEWSHG